MSDNHEMIIASARKQADHVLLPAGLKAFRPTAIWTVCRAEHTLTKITFDLHLVSEGIN